MLLTSLRQRSRQPELMDDPALPPAEHEHALAALARVNALTRSEALFWPALKEIAEQLHPKPVRVLDIATGSGDIPRRLAASAKSRGLNLELAGCDISPVAVKEAQRQTPNVHFFQQDVLNAPLPTGYDVLTCSLFLHHLEEVQQVQLLREMARVAGVAVLVNDLMRSRLNFCLVWLGCQLMTRSRVVHVDGPLSVRAALTVPEMKAVAQQAGLTTAKVRRVFPCRMLLTWQK